MLNLTLAVAGSQEAPSPVFWIGYIAILFGIMYVMVIRPQRRKEKDRQDLISKVKTDDRVLFSGGIIGIVTNVKDKTLVIKIADKTKIEVLRGAVSQVLGSGELPSEVDQPSGK